MLMLRLGPSQGKHSPEAFPRHLPNLPAQPVVAGQLAAGMGLRAAGCLLPGTGGNVHPCNTVVGAATWSGGSGSGGVLSPPSAQPPPPCPHLQKLRHRPESARCVKQNLRSWDRSDSPSGSSDSPGSPLVSSFFSHVLSASSSVASSHHVTTSPGTSSTRWM